MLRLRQERHTHPRGLAISPQQSVALTLLPVSTDQPYDAVRQRPGGRSARIRAAALHAALEELAEVGYAAFSLDAVARRAGAHKTTLYRRWGTPDDLLLEAMTEAAQESVPIPDSGASAA